MSDDPRKTGEPDRSLLSATQKHEWRYELEKMGDQFKKCTKEEIEKALHEALKEVSPSESRDRVEEVARIRLLAISLLRN